MTNGYPEILTRAFEAANGNLIQTAFFHLRASQAASGAVEKTELINKKDEIISLTNFADLGGYWFYDIKPENYIGEGAEQKVYLCEDGKSVIKTNDTIFYASWYEYLINLLIHNILFPNTAYNLLGFYQENDSFFAVVKQSFIASTEPTDLAKLHNFLVQSGFTHKRNNDYFHKELGIILEDLHDENVLTNHGEFFFIDSAIYLM